MKVIQQQLLIAGTILFLLGLLLGFALPGLANPRMGMSAHAAAVQSGTALWALGLMWQRLALRPRWQRATEALAVLSLYALVAGLLLAALWGASRAAPIAGVGFHSSPAHEAVVSALMIGGSVALVVAIGLVLWGLLAWKVTEQGQQTRRSKKVRGGWTAR